MQKHKLRTLMTMFGIIWGTVSLIILMSFGEGVYRHSLKEFRGMGERVAIVWPGSTRMPFRGLPTGRDILMVPEDAEYLKREIPDIAAVSPEFSRRVTLRVGKKQMNQSVGGVYPEYADMRNVIPGSGRFINVIDQQYRKRNIFSGDQYSRRSIWRRLRRNWTIRLCTGGPISGRRCAAGEKSEFQLQFSRCRPRVHRLQYFSGDVW